MYGYSFGHFTSSLAVVADDFHLVRITASPRKTDTILIVDANTELPFTAATQFLQSIARRSAKISQIRRRVQHQEFSMRPHHH
jgi:hypothetical protein